MKEQDLRLEFAALDEVSLPDREAVLGRVTAGLACEDAREDARENARTAPHPRRRAWKLLLPIAACVAVMVMLLAVMIIGADEPEPYLPDNFEEWFVRPGEPYVDHEVAESLTEDMTLGEIVAQIGKPNWHLTNVFVGNDTLHWEMDDGRHLFIRYGPYRHLEKRGENIPADSIPIHGIFIYDPQLERPEPLAGVYDHYEHIDFESLWRKNEETSAEETIPTSESNLHESN